jgi:hypothetical protein
VQRGMHLPNDEQELYVWIAVITAIYLGVAYLIQFKSKGFADQDRYALTRVFDATTFSGSSMLLLGLMAPNVLVAIGSTKLFLLIAGFGGVVYGLHALAPR